MSNVRRIYPNEENCMYLTILNDEKKHQKPILATPTLAKNDMNVQHETEKDLCSNIPITVLVRNIGSCYVESDATFKVTVEEEIVESYGNRNFDDDYEITKQRVYIDVNTETLPQEGILELHIHQNDLGWLEDRHENYCQHLIIVIKYNSIEELEYNIYCFQGKNVNDIQKGDSCGFN